MELGAGRGRFADLCRDLFVLAQSTDVDQPRRGPQRGWEWEGRIAETLSRRGYPAEPMPGGVQVFGALPASGLRHQTDSAIHCRDAHVIAEWKSYSAPVPKNELLRFKAATDDIYDSWIRNQTSLPILRLFGVGGDAGDSLRWYAARHGISLVERSRWPAAVLSDPSICWPTNLAPSKSDRRRLQWLSRSMQEVYPRLPDGALVFPPQPPGSAIEAILALQDRWSTRLWAALDTEPGTFESIAELLGA